MTDKRIDEIRGRLEAVEALGWEALAGESWEDTIWDGSDVVAEVYDEAFHGLVKSAAPDIRYLLARVDALRRSRDEWKDNAIHEANKREPKP